MTVFGANNQIFNFKWGFDYISQTRAEQTTVSASGTLAEYGVAEYGIGEYTSGLTLATVYANAGGVGKVIQAGMECQVSGNQISIQRLDVYTKDGAYK